MQFQQGLEVFTFNLVLSCCSQTPKPPRKQGWASQLEDQRPVTCMPLIPFTPAESKSTVRYATVDMQDQQTPTHSTPDHRCRSKARGMPRAHENDLVELKAKYMAAGLSFQFWLTDARAADI